MKGNAIYIGADASLGKCFRRGEPLRPLLHDEHDLADVVGVVDASMRGGCLRERGPNGFLDDAEGTMALVRALGLEGRLRRASEKAARRFVFRGPGLWRIPATRTEFLFSRLLSFGAKLRVMFEPFSRRAPDAS